MPPRGFSRRSFHVAWTTATHGCMASMMGYFAVCSRYRMPPHGWSQAFVDVTILQRFLRQLRWLPVRQPVTFKAPELVHQSLAEVVPAYLADDCRLLSEIGRRTLQSSSNAPRNHEFGDRISFLAAGSRMWNDLLPGLRWLDLSFPMFRQTLLFD